MNEIEAVLREVMGLLDGVSVSGHENRKRMAQAEDRILAVANACARLGKQFGEKKEAESHEENENE